MSNLDGALIDEATAGINRPLDGDQNAVVRVDNAQAPDPPNLSYQALDAFVAELAGELGALPVLGVIRRTVLTGAGTHNFHANTRSYSLVLQGAAAAGGGAAATGPSESSVGSGGGAGECVEDFIAIEEGETSATYSLAAAGAANVGLAGSNASASTFEYAGTTYTANGGEGGTVLTVDDPDAATSGIGRAAFVRGGLGGTGGLVGSVFRGAPGGPGMLFAEINTGMALGGDGGTSRFGGAGRGGVSTGGVGAAGAHGSGGAGSANKGGAPSPAIAGGLGSAAFAIVIEFGTTPA